MFITSKQSVKNNFKPNYLFLCRIRQQLQIFSKFFISAQVAETTTQNVIWLQNLTLTLKNVNKRKLWHLSLYAFERVLEV
jgi:predicted DNA-binding protein YlxM (UPF0122 family)